jgi:fido (protein-threonine AMPylation protein)
VTRKPAKKPDIQSLWQAAAGLQAVDGLKTSEFLAGIAEEHAAGRLTLAQAEAGLDAYYLGREQAADRTQEADKVALRIVQELLTPGFRFTAEEYLGIHRRLFTGLYEHAGKVRSTDISKREPVLFGASVIYGAASELKAVLDYDLETERRFSYEGRTDEETVRHLARFAANLWQNHVFAEGNTRTTAVFLVKYLQSLGFHPAVGVFADNSLYFRNALVRANCGDRRSGVAAEPKYLELFLRCLMFGEVHSLENRTLVIQKADIGL